MLRGGLLVWLMRRDVATDAESVGKDIRVQRASVCKGVLSFINVGQDQLAYS